MSAVFQQLLRPVIVALRGLAVSVAGGKLRGGELDVIAVLGAVFVVVRAVKLMRIHAVNVYIRDVELSFPDHLLHGEQRVTEQLLFLLAEGVRHLAGHQLPVQG